MSRWNTVDLGHFVHLAFSRASIGQIALNIYSFKKWLLKNGSDA